MWHGYLGIENVNLNATQRGALLDALKALGPKKHEQPACLCHWIVRPDGQAAIFEALFDEDHLTVDAFKARLGAIFGVSPATIEHTLSSATFAVRPTPIATFSRNGTDYLRMALFGGIGAQWMESGDECRAYLAANREAWEA